MSTYPQGRRSPLGVTTAERFEQNVRTNVDCHVWTGSTSGTGYGHLHVDGVEVLAHRYAYEQAYGPIPEGLVIDHLCRVRTCVNPEHLEAVTTRENNVRGTITAGRTTLAPLTVGDRCRRGLHDIKADRDLYIRPGSPDARPQCRACVALQQKEYRERRAAKREETAA